MKFFNFLELIAAEVYTFGRYKGNETVIQDLTIKDLKYTSIDEEGLSKFISLRRLKIHNTSVTKIPSGLERLSHLRSLVFSNNKNATFDNLVELQNCRISLDLSSNGLLSIPSVIFKLKLDNLSLNDNEIKKLPCEIGELDTLTTLSLNGNQLEEIPNSISNLFRLGKLDLSRNRITKLFPEFINLQNLTELDLSHNKFTTMPLEITVLNKLKTLRLEDNSIANLKSTSTELDSFIEQCCRVRGYSREHFNYLEREHTYTREECALQLDSRLKGYRNGFFNLASLLFLSISENKIDEIPKEVNLLTELKRLYCIRNNIKTIPLELTELNNLTALFLQCNRITALPYEFRRFMNRLFTLCISHNCIAKYNSHTGLGLYGIKELRFWRLFCEGQNNQPINKFAYLFM